uniref:BCL2 interacting protein 3 n=2 Tax=Catarrhini TaxID=9526 RepID=A0A2K5W3H4_MACFA
MSQNGAPGMQEESLQGSWVELHFSNNGNGSSVPASVSIYNGDMEKILLDAQHESGRSSSKSSHCDSPPRSQTPQDTNRASETDTHSIGEKNSSQSEEDDIERRKEVESILKKNSDWIWDWSSRPENIPPKEFLFKHPKRTATLSMRNTSVMKKGGIFSAEFLKVFLPSLLLSHLLAIGLGPGQPGFRFCPLSWRPILLPPGVMPAGQLERASLADTPASLVWDIFPTTEFKPREGRVFIFKQLTLVRLVAMNWQHHLALDLYWKASDNLHQHLLMKNWSLTWFISGITSELATQLTEELLDPGVAASLVFICSVNAAFLI